MHYSYFLTSRVPVLQQKSQNYKLAFLRTLRQRFWSRDKIITCVLITKHCLVNRVATVNWMWNLRTFPGPFEQIQQPSVPNKIIIYYIENMFLFRFLIQQLNELYKIWFWEKIELLFLFSNIVTLKVSCPVMTNSSSWLFFCSQRLNILSIPGFS